MNIQPDSPSEIPYYEVAILIKHLTAHCITDTLSIVIVVLHL